MNVVAISKICFDTGMKEQFSFNKMQEVASLYGITAEKTLDYAKSYYIYILGNSENDWDLLMEKTFQKEKEENLTSEEFIRNSLQNRLLNDSLERENCDEFMSKLSEYCYQFCERVKFDCNKVWEEVLLLGITYEEFEERANSYAISKKLPEVKLIKNNMDNVSDEDLSLKSWLANSLKRQRCYDRLGGKTFEEFREKLMKEIFTYGSLVNFDKEKLIKCGKKYDLSYKTVKSYIIMYAKDVLGYDAQKIDFLFRKNDDPVFKDRKIVEWIGSSEKRKQLYIKLGCLPFEEFKKELMKRTYYYFLEVNFDTSKISDFALDYDLSITTVRRYALKYATEYLGFSEAEWKEMRNTCLKDKKLKTWLGVSSKHEKLYEELGGGSYDFFRSKLFDLSYQYANSVDFDVFKISKFCLKWDIIYADFIGYIKNYVANHPEVDRNMIEDKIETMYRQRRNDFFSVKYGKLASIIERLEKANDVEEIAGILENENVDMVNGYIFDYVIVHYREIEKNQKEMIINDLRNKIRDYRKYLKILEDNKLSIKKQQVLNEARRLIKEFITSGIEDQQIFCISRKILFGDFEKMKLLVREFDSSLYLEYEHYIQRWRNKRYAIMIETVNKIVEKIKYGIEENGVKREFDLFDYYMITSLSFEDVMRIGREVLKSSDSILLCNFIRKNKDNSISEEEIINIKLIVSGREITEIEKVAIINYLKELVIPLNYRLFHNVLNRYLAGKFELEKGKRLVRIKEEDTNKGQS